MSNKQQVGSVPSYSQQDSMPTKKVLTGGAVASVTTILVWLLNTYVVSEPIPGEVASAITTVLSFGLAWAVSPAASDQIVPS